MLLTDHTTNYHVILWNKSGEGINYTMLHKSFEFINNDYDFCLFLKFDMPLDLYNIDVDSLKIKLGQLFGIYESPFVLLTLHQPAPIDRESPDEFIFSFACQFSALKHIISLYNQNHFLNSDFIFEIFDLVCSGKTSIKSILAKQIPFEITLVDDNINCDVIIPHKGDNVYLNTLLSFIHHKGLNLLIGHDGGLSSDILEDIKTRFPDAKYYNFEPCPVGPYIVRNRLIEEGENELIFFQDSDDLPCADRFPMLSQFIISNKAQLSGSHEIQMNYEEKTLRAIRYPLNVKDALSVGMGHSLLHPSSVILRKSFYLCNTLSEERTFGNDTKFLYQSHFYFDTILNIDEFLYIRRIRPNSLTTSPNTVIGSPARFHLMKNLTRDFCLVKLGKLALEESCLAFQPTKINVLVTKL